jgi:hypothetical protein
MDLGIEDPSPTIEQSSRRRGGLGTGQWVVLALMGGLLLAIGAALVLILRLGIAGAADVSAAAGATVSPELKVLVGDAVPTPEGLYWPPEPQPLATPNAPGDLMWWDARFAYRRPILLDAIAAQAAQGTPAHVLWDGQRAQHEGRVRADGADLRVLVWDGRQWHEIPRRVLVRQEETGWDVFFRLQGAELEHDAGVPAYYLYYGHPGSESAPVAQDLAEASRLLLALGAEQGAEWGPRVAWAADSTITQSLVSPDGRIVIQHPPGGLNEDTWVRLRTVPVAERKGYGPLPSFELHADPPPTSPGPDGIVRWDPPVTILINWVGLPVGEQDLQSWVHFIYDSGAGTWFTVPAEFDAERGVIRLTTDQP